MEEEMKEQQAATEQPTDQKENLNPEDAKPADAAPEKPEDAPAEQPEDTPRILLRRKMSEIYTDDNYDEDPEALAKRVMSHIDKIEEDARLNKEFMDGLTKRAQQSPTQAAALLDWVSGKSWPEAIRKNMGEDALVMKEGMEGWDDYEKSQQERDESFKKHKELIEEMQTNATASEAAFKEFCEEEGLSEEDANALWEDMQNVLNDVTRGKISKDAFKNFRRGKTYDADIEAAREQGRQEGADEKIKLERKRMQGSGLPNGGAGNGANKDSEEKEDGTLRILRGISKFNR